MDEICTKNLCTGCGACVNICPKQCISWVKDDIDTFYPLINHELCVDCGACKRVCPNNNNLDYHHPLKTYAAWSLDKENRRTSASGGIVSEFYRFAIARDGFTSGVELTLEKGANYIPVQNEDDINKVKNSKYVFSHTNDIYKQVRQALLNKRFVFFVGLPCQVAGLKTYLGKLADSENLLLADILCHGVSNEDYLIQYVHHVEITLRQKAEKISFRDPEYGSEGYVFTLRAKTNPSGAKGTSSASLTIKPFYMQNHYGSNLYYIGYMEALTYRENCYHCRYARTERISDITFGDFDGLGAEIPFNHWNKQVSLCLVNTEKGLRFLSEITDKLFLEERNLDEAVKPQQQLKSPALKHQKRDIFLLKYRSTHDFTKSAKVSLKSSLYRNLRKNIARSVFVNPILHLTTKEQRNIIKRLFKR